MKKPAYETILSFLIGVSWAFLLLGALLTFQTSLVFGFMTALFSTIIYIFILLFFILILEMINLYKENHDENRKQTALLHEIHDVLKKEKVNYEVRETPLSEDD